MQYKEQSARTEISCSTWMLLSLCSKKYIKKTDQKFGIHAKEGIDSDKNDVKTDSRMWTF